MENQDNMAAWARYFDVCNKEMDHRFPAYRTAAPDLVISAMPIRVEYTAKVGRVEHFKRGDEHVFVQTYALQDGRVGEEWQEVPENPYAIRDEFFKVKSYEQVPEFLRKTGLFSPLSDTITWREFQKWQQFARLVQEHNELATAMREKKWSEDCGEVLKALTGDYPSAFFDGCELAEPPEMAESVRKLLRESPEIARQVEEGKHQQEQLRRDLWGWFRRPPVSIEWIPNSADAAQKVLKKYVDPATKLAIPIAEESPIMHGGAMIEFLLRQDQLRPVLRIVPKTALQAIAAAIFAERVQGVTYKKCVWCDDQFRVGEAGKYGRYKDRQHCYSKRCKENANKTQTRKKAKEQKAQKQASGERAKIATKANGKGAPE